MTEHPINCLMSVTMQKIKEMVDVNTVIGTPLYLQDGTVIIPISKVSFGFASGGADLPSKQPRDLFGGGSGAGVSVNPMGFLVANRGNIRLFQLAEGTSPAEKAVSLVPEFIDRISELINKNKE